MKKLIRIGVSVCVLALHACVADVVTTDSSEVENAMAALSAIPEENSQCSPSLLSWDQETSACDGPWEYHYRCLKRIPACPGISRLCQFDREQLKQLPYPSREFENWYEVRHTFDREDSSGDRNLDDAPITDQQGCETHALRLVHKRVMERWDDPNRTGQYGDAAFTAKFEAGTCAITLYLPKPSSSDRVLTSCPADRWTNPICELPPSACNQPLYTATGLMAAEVDAQASSPIVQKSCTTCQDLADATPSARFECLKGFIDATNRTSDNRIPVPTRNTIRQRNRKHLRLLYDRSREELETPQVTYAEQLMVSDTYDVSFGPYDACLSGTFRPSPEFSNCPQPELQRVLGTCQRQLGHLVEKDVVLGRVDECLDALAVLAALPAAQGRGWDRNVVNARDIECHASNRDVMRKTSVDLVSKALSAQLDLSADLSPLIDALILLQKWYDAQLAAYSRDLDIASAEKNIAPEIQRLLDTLWKSVGKARGAAQGTVTEDNVAAFLDHFSDVESRVNQDMVIAAFTDYGDTTVLHGVPLAALLGRAFKPLAMQLDAISPYHDIGCMLASACSEADSPLTKLWQLLAVLPFPGDVQDALADRPTLDLGGWRDVFGSLDERDVWEELLRLYPPLDPHAETIGGRVTGVDLVDVVRRAHNRFGRYMKTGQILGDNATTLSAPDTSAPGTLRMGVDRASRQRVVDYVINRIGRVDEFRKEYESSMFAMAQGLIDEHGLGMSQRSTQDRAAETNARWLELARDLAGLQKTAKAEEGRLGTFMREFATTNSALRDDAYFTVASTETIRLSAADARYPGYDRRGYEFHLSSVVAKDLGEVRAGQMLVLQTSGRWGPSCALQLDGSLGEDRSGALGLTGPEGYVGVVEHGQVEAHADTETSSTTETSAVTDSLQLCLTATAGYNYFGNGAQLSAQGCKGWERSTSESTTDQTSVSRTSSTSTAAKFSYGLRSFRAPYGEDAPAGSLLLVLTDDKNEIADIQVVLSGDMHVLIPQDGKAYFVVNDATGCSVLDTSPLTVRLNRLSSAKLEAEAISQAMIKVLESTLAPSDDLVAQGQLLPEQLALREAEAMNQLQVELGTGYILDELPRALMRLFELYVRSQNVRLSLLVQIRATQRALDLLDLESTHLLRSLEDSEQNAAIRRLIPQWRLQNLEAVFLETRAQELSSTVRDYFMPIVRLWYPDALLDPEANRLARELKELPLQARPLDRATKALALLDELVDAYLRVELGYKTPPAQRRVIGLAFPKPLTRSDDPSRIELTDYPKAGDERSRAVWNAVFRREWGTFTVEPADIYRALGFERGTLPCDHALPVVHSIGLYFVSPNENQDFDNLWAAARADEMQSYASVDGPMLYRMVNNRYQTFDVIALDGPAVNVAQTFRDTPKPQEPIGISPFTTMQIAFGGLQGRTDPRVRTAVELVLLMEVDTLKDGRPLGWVRTCAE